MKPMAWALFPRRTSKVPTMAWLTAAPRYNRVHATRVLPNSVAIISAVRPSVCSGSNHNQSEHTTTHSHHDAPSLAKLPSITDRGVVDVGSPVQQTPHQLFIAERRSAHQRGRPLHWHLGGCFIHLPLANHHTSLWVHTRQLPPQPKQDKAQMMNTLYSTRKQQNNHPLRDPHLWLRLVYGSAPIEQGPSYFQVAVLTSNVQRGPTSLLPARVPNHAKQKS